MRYSIRTVTPASAVPLVVDVPAAKAHLRVDTDADDALIDAQLRAAQDHVERYTSRLLTAREMELALAGFPLLPELIAIPRDPVTSITSIAYTDTSGEAVAMAAGDWRWSEASPDVIKPAFGASWPTAADEAGSVIVRFMGGYDDGLAPPALVQAVKMMLGHLYANREAEDMPAGVAALCAPYRRISI